MPITAKGGRPAGLPKTGGRTKGTPNRATLTLREKLEEMGYDPVLAMAEMSRDPKTSPELKFQCHREVALYVHPKRKPQDAAGPERPVINVNTTLDCPGECSHVRDQSESEAEAETGRSL
jgi:hypothetical protein